MHFGIVAYALMLFSWTTFLETAVYLLKSVRVKRQKMIISQWQIRASSYERSRLGCLISIYFLGENSTEHTELHSEKAINGLWILLIMTSSHSASWTVLKYQDEFERHLVEVQFSDSDGST